MTRDVYVLVTPRGMRSYLVKGDRGWVIIDGGDPVSLNIIVSDILEVTRGVTPKYILVTSCHPAAASAIGALSKFFVESLVVSHYPDSVALRRGECEGSFYEPARVSVELRSDEEVVEGIRIKLTRTPTLGSIIANYNGVIFAGSTLVSPLKTVSYLCSVSDCSKVS